MKPVPKPAAPGPVPHTPPQSAPDGAAPLSLARSACTLVAAAAPVLLTGYAVLTLAAGVLPVATAWLTKLVLDALADGAPLAQVARPAMGLAAAGVALVLTGEVAQYLRAQLGREVAVTAQERLYRAVDGFVGLRRLEDPAFLDRLRLAQQSGGASPGQVLDAVLTVAGSVFTVTGFLGSLFVLSPLMTLLVTAASVPVLAAELWLSRLRARMAWDLGPVERREFFYSTLLSRMEAAKEVRLFGTGAFLRGRMVADRRAVNEARRGLDLREARVQTALGLLAALVSGGGLLWAVAAARDGRLSVGDVTIFVAAIVGVQGALASLATAFARTHQALLLFGHYTAVVDAGPDLPVPPEPRTLPALRHGIELKDVWFRYADDHPWVLRGIDLFLPHGTSLALVGLNGAGKSTLIKLICRFYDPTRGAVLWDGVDLRDTDPAELRSRLGAVFQDYMNYDMTATENIALGDISASPDHSRVAAAAARAGIAPQLAALPHGYDTLLSRIFFAGTDRDDPETGVVLSGGQWQRLALARAFLRDRRDLMILDEPSSGLDAEAEAEIHSSLKRHRSGRTSLLISHRLGAVREADTIAVLRDGRIAELGSHDALMAAEGAYARLFALQAAGYRDTTAAPNGRQP
ncbi:ATP-binding cassette domain-containing protein [Streptomyces sp. SID8375]|uniref:ABC transporter ATP-binding protein n=1 Tax=unclassified Streptomyces TaxID=2593676 RepID=UPI00037F4F5C|nr:MULTISPECIES: ABC transporter ATP-binding protein [unclassified Streptomyces]MYX08108.1 ATP-binding cassette domain-containing protein [Streptomyces sp. SID8375]